MRESLLVLRWRFLVTPAPAASRKRPKSVPDMSTQIRKARTTFVSQTKVKKERKSTEARKQVHVTWLRGGGEAHDSSKSETSAESCSVLCELDDGATLIVCCCCLSFCC
jgi:hypothetical protein